MNNSKQTMPVSPQTPVVISDDNLFPQPHLYSGYPETINSSFRNMEHQHTLRQPDSILQHTAGLNFHNFPSNITGMHHFPNIGMNEDLPMGLGPIQYDCIPRSPKGITESQSFPPHSLQDHSRDENLHHYPLMNLETKEADNGFSSYFPNISTDLSTEERPLKKPKLNLVKVSYYPTPEHHTEDSRGSISFNGYDMSSSESSSESSPSKRRNSAHSPVSLYRADDHTPARKAASCPDISQNSESGAHTTQPGPIPASEPRVSIDSETGDELVSFSYSKQKIIKNFTIRYPTEPISIDDIPEQFLIENCVYPRAMVPPEEYKGNRGKYERECNEIGWRLCWYNPEIRNHRGLTQRAVDSWRNTRSDKNVRSRRVRKNAQSHK